MKVAIYVCGGLGNQLFQFACLIAYCRKHNFEPIFDRRFVRALHTKDLFYDQWEPIRSVIKEGNIGNNYHKYEENQSVFQEIPLFQNQKENLLITGYFNDERYFIESKEEIITLFNKCIFFSSSPSSPSSFPSSTQYFEKEMKESIGVHIRRGDYLQYKNVFYSQTPSYYKKCIDYLMDSFSEISNQESKIEIYGENQEALNWYRQNVSSKILFDREEKYFCNEILNDFRGLALCKTKIIANSTFSWWAAYLTSDFSVEIFYPMEWFLLPELKDTYKYNVLPNKGEWHMVSNNNNRTVINTIYSYISKNRWDLVNQVKSNIIYKDINPADMNHVNHIDFLVDKNISSLKSVLGGKVDSNIRRNYYQLSQSKTLVNLKEIPIYIITMYNERIKLMKEVFSSKGITNLTFIEGVVGKNVWDGCTRAHLKALEKAMEVGIYPFLICEDDLKITDHYKESFPVPCYTDAVFLGISCHGLEDKERSISSQKGNINVTEDVTIENVKYYQIENMLGGHAILYMNEEYAEKYKNVLKVCVTLNIINDIGSAKLQKETNILCMENPMFVQDVKFGKDKYQKQNNLDTYIGVKNLKVIPLDRKLFIENITLPSNP